MGPPSMTTRRARAITRRATPALCGSGFVSAVRGGLQCEPMLTESHLANGVSICGNGHPIRAAVIGLSERHVTGDIQNSRFIPILWGSPGGTKNHAAGCPLGNAALAGEGSGAGQDKCLDVSAG